MDLDLIPNLDGLSDDQKQKVLEDTMIAIRNSYIDDQIKALRFKAANPTTPHDQQMDLIREMDALRLEKNKPLEVLREVPKPPNCVGCDDLKQLHVPGTGAPFDSWPCPKCCEAEFKAAMKSAEEATKIPFYVLIKRFAQYLYDADPVHYAKLNAE